MAKIAKWGVISPQPLRVAAMHQRLVTAMKNVGADIHRDFSKTTATWQNPADFGPSPPPVQQGSNFIQVTVETSDKRYRWIDEGTKSHAIFPRNASALVFPGTFSSKSKPRVIQSYPGFSGPPTQFRQWVAHPGVKAREFDETIAKRQQVKFQRAMTTAMQRAAQSSGHAIP